MAYPGLQLAALDLAESGLRRIQVLAEDETATAAQAKVSLELLNRMLDGWQAEGFLPFTVNINDFPLVAGKQTYTLGTGGDFNLARPAKVELVSLIVLANPVNPLELSMYYTQAEVEWQAILLKAIQTSYPQFCYDDGSFPFRNLNFWPVPRDNNNIRIYSWSPLAQFADLKTKLIFPPGYAEAMDYNLTLRLYDAFGGVLPPTVPTMAVSFIQRIKTLNVPIVKLGCDEIVLGGKPSTTNFRQELFNIP